MKTCRRTICGHLFAEHTETRKLELPETISRGGKVQRRIRAITIRGCSQCRCTDFAPITCDRLGKFPGDRQYRRHDSGDGEAPQ